MTSINVEHLFKVFGPSKRIEEAVRLAREGASRADVLEKSECTVAVHDVTFDVEGPEIFVIMGLSGSGKSTLLRCINRLIDPTAGQVLVDGESVLDLDHKQVLKLREEKLSMVFQNFGLLAHKSVLENVAFGLELRDVPRAEREEKARETLQLVGLADHAESEITELSGGMQQRVGLARALATNADVLLMDEAFSALDPLIRAEMQSEFLELQKEMPKTVLFVTHDLGEALMLGDRIAIMKDGAMVQIGGPEEIVLEPDSEYVESFVENVDRSRVLTVATVGSEQATVSRSGSVDDAIRTMKKMELPFVFVVDDGRPSGVVRLRDAEKEAAGGASKVETIMAPAPEPVRPDQVLIEILCNAVAAPAPLPVVDDEGRLEGVLTKDMLLRAIAGAKS